MPHGRVLPPARNLIGGEWLPATSGAVMPMISPIDGQPFAMIAESGPEDVDAAVRAARTALEGDWGRLTAAERGRLMLRLALRIEDEAEALAQLETRDNGKPVAQSRADMTALARYFEYYGGAAGLCCTNG
ncbi:aldehyde dehydrogenase family protein [uncultured Paracoccus sp.]|uniref:aldehyde dehydrogenase family protein n=1 Tax=uncultured Paracoccus sp. TaxID=189685 RepID=UPI002596BCAA|nr:aldehyde dehydrogenase family protein [uncultured Paracoccus sp.]